MPPEIIVTKPKKSKRKKVNIRESVLDDFGHYIETPSPYVSDATPRDPTPIYIPPAPVKVIF